MDGEGHAGEQEAEAKARDKVEEDPLHRRGIFVEEVEEADAEGGKDPAGPERPAVAADFRDDDASDHGGGGDGEGFGEEADAGDDGGFAFDGFVVEGEVVQDGPKDDAVQDGLEVRGGSSAILEDVKADQGLRSYEFLEDNEHNQANGADDERDESSPRIPCVHYSSPSNRDEEAGR